MTKTCGRIQSLRFWFRAIHLVLFSFSNNLCLWYINQRNNRKDFTLGYYNMHKLHDHYMIMLYNLMNLIIVSKLFDIIVSSKCHKCLPTTIISNMDFLLRKNGCIRVSMQQMIQNFGFFSGIITDSRNTIIQSGTQPA